MQWVGGAGACVGGGAGECAGVCAGGSGQAEQACLLELRIEGHARSVRPSAHLVRVRESGFGFGFEFEYGFGFCLGRGIPIPNPDPTPARLDVDQLGGRHERPSP